MGAIIYDFGRSHPDIEFTGLEINPHCVRRGNERLTALAAHNCRLELADLYQAADHYSDRFNGIISCATLSWLPDFAQAAGKIAELNPGWIAATSLFYDGPIDCIVETRDYSRPLEAPDLDFW